MKRVFQRCSWHVIRCLLLFLSLAVALNACMALWDIYGLEWYAVHFENNAAARYYTSNAVLIMMCVLCFPCVDTLYRHRSGVMGCGLNDGKIVDSTLYQKYGNGNNGTMAHIFRCLQHTHIFHFTNPFGTG